MVVPRVSALGRRLVSTLRQESAGYWASDEANLFLEARDAQTFTLCGATDSLLGLSADLAVKVAPDAALPSNWHGAYRVACARPPTTFGAARGDAVPEELADENLLGIDPARLLFVLLGAAAPGPLFERLDALFPGAPAVAATFSRVSRSCADEALVGAAVVDGGDPAPLARALADLAPHTFSANAAASRRLFLPEGPRGRACADRGVPLFVLDGAAPRMRVGESRTLRAVESRYKLLVKECVDGDAPLVVVGGDANAVGAVCRVADAAHDPVLGASVAVVTCESHAVPDRPAASRPDFGLVRARGLTPA